jgi:flavin reductase (DIM6/NTAB) family NADH-FMN oxidoreductase RutF
MPVTAEQFRETLKDFPGGVTIVTSSDTYGGSVGATVSAFASVSIDPPLVLVCLRRESNSVSAIRARGAFAVHVLDADKADLARQFATDGVDKFDGVSFELNDRGVPCLLECASRLECDLYNELPGGDHIIVVGLVTAAMPSDSSVFQPLLYSSRRFYSLGGEIA